MKRIYYAIAFVTALIMLCGCGTRITFDQKKRTPATDKNVWSVFIYACSDNGGKTSQAIEELTKIDYPENVNIVMQTGGGVEWEMDGIDGEYLQRFEMQKGGAFLKDQKQGASMGSYGVFSDFIKWGMETYPADNNILIVMGEGTGLEIVRDEVNDGDTLNIEELYYGLSMTGEVLDAICFDGAYMSSIEVASSLPNYARYMVASEEQCAGFDYKALAECIKEYPMASVEEICKNMCDSYMKKCADKGITKMSQMSLIDLSQMSQLSQAFDGMAMEMVSKTKSLSELGAITRMMESAQRCAGSEMVDIASLAESVREATGETADFINEALSHTVKYSVKGSMRAASSGISVYYPTKTEEWTLNEYMKHALSDNYKQFLKNTITDADISAEYITSDYSDTSAWKEYNENTLSGRFVTEGNKSAVYMEGDKNMIKNTSLHRYRADNGKYLSCGESMDLECYWEEGSYKSDTVMAVPTLRGVPLDVSVASRNADYTIYCTEILFNEKMSQLYVSYSNATQEYECIGIWDNGSFKKGKLGDKVVLTEKEKESGKLLVGKSFNVLFGLNVKTQNLPSGDYLMEYVIEDVYRNKIPCGAEISVN